VRPSEMYELHTVDVEKRLREKRDDFVLKQHLSAKSDAWKRFSLKPNSITLAASKLVRSLSQTGSKLVRSWLEAGRRQVRSQIPLRYLVRSWFEAGCRQVRFEAGRRPASNLSATSFEPASNQLE